MNERHAAKFTRDLLELLDGNGGEHWARRAFHSVFNWKGKIPKDKKECHCVMGGAKHLVRMGRSEKVSWKVQDAIEAKVGKPIPQWNDDLETKWKDVKSVLTSVAKDFEAA